MIVSGFPEVLETVPSMIHCGVNPVTGDMKLMYIFYGAPALGSAFFMARAYIPKRSGIDVFNEKVLGEKWALNIVGKIIRKNDKIWLPMYNFQREAFFLEKGTWKNIDGKSYLRLEEKRSGFHLKDLSESADYFYDQNGNLISAQQIGAPKTEVVYYNDIPIKVILSSGITLTLTWQGNKIASLTDNIGRTFSYEYSGELLTRVIYPGGSFLSYEYDVNGLIISGTNKSGNRIFFNMYDDVGRIVNQVNNDKNTDYHYSNLKEKRHCIVLDKDTMNYHVYYWNPKGELYRYVDENGSDEFYFYNNNGQQTRLLDKDENEHRWEYGNDGLLLREIHPSGLVEEYAYDKTKRIVSIKDNMDGEVQFRYNEKGCMIEKRTRLTAKNWRVETWQYDYRSRIIAYTIGSSHTVYSYENEKAPYPNMMETPCGYIFNYTYDDVYRLLSIKCPLGEKFFSYNNMDLVTRVSISSSQGEKVYQSKAKTFFYDLDGHPLFSDKEVYCHKINFPGSIRKKYVKPTADIAYNDQEYKKKYDMKGHLMEVRSRQTNELVGKFTYDIAGRLEEERILTSPGSYNIKKIRYDENDNVTELLIWLTLQTNITGSVGRVYTISYKYDLEDRLIRMEGSNKDVIEYEWNALSLVTRVKQYVGNEAPSVTNYIYDPEGHLIEVEEKSDYRITGKLWDRTLFSIGTDGNCIKVVHPNGEERFGKEAEDFYKFILAPLPKHIDISGYRN